MSASLSPKRPDRTADEGASRAALEVGEEQQKPREAGLVRHWRRPAGACAWGGGGWRGD
jgi:hypothetical protein